MRKITLISAAFGLTVAACGVVNPSTYGTLLPLETGVMRLSFSVHGNAWRCSGRVRAESIRSVPRQTVPIQCIGMANSGTATLETDPRTEFTNISYKLSNGISGTMVFD